MVLAWHCVYTMFWHIIARIWVTVLGLLWGNSRCPMGQWFTVAIKCACLYVLVVLQCVVFRVSC